MSQPASSADGLPASGLAGAPQVVTMARQSDGLVQCAYEGEVPDYAEAELVRLYGSSFSSLAHLRAVAPEEVVSTYVARAGGQVCALLLFRIEGRRLRVLNEVLQIPALEVSRFVSFVFARYPRVQVVLWRAVRCEDLLTAYPCQRVNMLEDVVVSLPARLEDYHASLGKNARRNLRRYGARLAEARPQARFELLAAPGIDDGRLQALLGLARQRMARKHKAWGMDPGQEAALLREVQVNGMLGTIQEADRVLAGAVGLRCGSSFYLCVIGHDPEFDPLSLGFLCCYQMIAACQAAGCREFHFLWGEYDYKAALGGVRRGLDTLAFYRSGLQVLQHAPLALRLLRLALRRRLRARLRPLAGALRT